MSHKVKGRKLHRRGSGVFNKNARKKAILKNIGLVCLALLMIPAGFLAAKFIMEDNPDSQTELTSAVNADPSSNPSAAVTTPATTVKPIPATPQGSLRTFYLPFSRLTQADFPDAVLDDATAAGFNAVLFDLKDDKGVLHYDSQTQSAQQSKAASDNAVTTQELKEILQKLEGKGFTAIGRIFAFRDPTAPSNLPSAKITLEDYPTYTWLDNSRDKGGKPWLNPYAPDAHNYIIGIAKELSDIGFTSIMLDGVQFPNQTSQAYYGNSELRSLSPLEVLKKFTGDLCTAVGDGCRVIHTVPGLSAFKDGTEPFGGNPVTFGADTLAPVLLPSTLGNKLRVGETTVSNPKESPYDAVKLATGQIKLRVQLMEQQPDIMPWLQAFEYNSQQINQQITAVKETIGKDFSFILYNPDGSYDFDAINIL
ncbi:MAG: putative glycoside hydrolase [Oscillospiraceae bacterium]|nr:putative glycoside hydrolase [Oscillospiraceae bacterium]MDD4413979.1 putative glycoside hydrolase [Oscillospiraceae bacterium]